MSEDVGRARRLCSTAFAIGVVTLATTFGASADAHAQFGSRGGAKFVGDTGTQLDWWVPLYGGRGMEVFGLTLDLEMTVWPLLGEPVVLTHAGYSWSSSRTTLTLYRGEESEQFFAADGDARPGWETVALIHVHDLDDWWIDDDQPLPEYRVPREEFEELVHVWGFTYTLNAPVIAPYSESFSGIILRDGRSFNVPGSRSWDRLFSSISAPTYRNASISHWGRHSANDARGRVERALEECPADDPCEGGLVNVPVVRMNAYALLSELARRSERFRDDFFGNPKEALVTELMGSTLQTYTSSLRERRAELVERALTGFDGDIHPSFDRQWRALSAADASRSDYRALDYLADATARLADEVAVCEEATPDTRESVGNALASVDAPRIGDRRADIERWLDARYEPPEPEPTDEGLGTGDVQVTLRWDSDTDVDLYVEEPGGDVISYQNRTGDRGGELDVDDTDGYGPENVFWPEGRAPAGRYRVRVRLFSGDRANWQVRVLNGGRVSNHSGTLIGGGDEDDVVAFDFRPGQPTEAADAGAASRDDRPEICRQGGS